MDKQNNLTWGHVPHNANDLNTLSLVFHYKHVCGHGKTGEHCVPMASGMNFPTSSFRSQEEASRVMISTIFFLICLI